MKKLILLISILVLVVMVAGCTSTSPKTYSANGVTFNYPANWTEQNSSSLQSSLGSIGTVLGVVSDGSSSMFAIAQRNLASNEVLNTPSDAAASYKSTMISSGATLVSEKQRTIDGANAYQITLQSSGSYVTDIFIVKNGKGYFATYSAPNNDQTNLDLILNSLKIT